MRRVFCASPAYLRRHGTPREPRELLAHRIGWYSGYPTRERLAFHGAGEPVPLELKPVLLTNSVHLLREYALEHAGIVCLPTLVASASILSGELELVLPDYALSAFWLSRVLPVHGAQRAEAQALPGRAVHQLFRRAAVGRALIERGLISEQVID